MTALAGGPAYLSALRQIDSIRVPDLASTLRSYNRATHSPLHPQYTPPPHLDSYSAYHDPEPDSADEANDANVSFLRTQLDPQDEWRAENAERERERSDATPATEPWSGLDARERTRERLRMAERLRRVGQSSVIAEEGRGEAVDYGRERRERLQRVLNRLNRIHEGSSSLLSSSVAPAASTNASGSYGERIPRENSLYDWSPANLDMEARQSERDGPREDGDDAELGDGDGYDAEAEQLRIYAQLRRDLPNENPEIQRRIALQRSRDLFRQRRGLADPTTATEAALSRSGSTQSVRRHPRFSARSREYMQRYIMDRERVSHDTDERDRWQEARNRISSTAAAWRAGASANTSSTAAGDSSDPYYHSRLAWSSSTHGRSSLDQPGSERARGAYRRSYLENPSRSRENDPTPEPSLWLQQTISYLARLRYCFDPEDALANAVEAGFVTKEFLGEGQDDFILDLENIPRPAETSWLAPGAVFSGSQHATNGYAWPITRARDLLHRESGSGNPWGPWASESTESLSETRRRVQARMARYAADTQSNSTQSRPNAPPDRWPVKVTIHAVDYDKMTIAATMEAYNVPSYNNAAANAISNNAPQHTRPISTESPLGLDPQAHPPILPKTSSITTYLEGEILDLTTHTFLTESYPSHKATDATYWRKLEPFAHLQTDDDMVRTLVSQRKMRELGERYVLMRWKERCFIPKSSTSTLSSIGPNSPSYLTSSFHSVADGPSRDEVWDGARPWMNSGDGVMAETGEGCGLTISGFYYVALRRSDGSVEGLYCDPESSPYQHLRLNRVSGGFFPTWGFR